MTQQERETRILDAVERLLVEDGLPAMSMAAIAEAVGMSKRTLYEVFASRSALFEACIGRIRSRLIRPLPQHEQHLPLEQRLVRIFEPEASNATLRVPLAVLRAVVIEAARHPDLGQAFLREGPSSAQEVVEAELARAVASGEAALEDPALAARMLCDMVFESPIPYLVDPGQPPTSAPCAERRLHFAIRTFLRGVATSPSA